MKVIKPMPQKPANALDGDIGQDGVDPISYAMWKMSCMNQLKEELESMFDVIERKVNSFEKKIKTECGRTDEDKLLKLSFIDYQDSCRLSKHRLSVLLTKEQKRHQNLIDELRFKKKAWEEEL